MMNFIYTIFYSIFAVINIPILLIKGKWKEGFVLRRGKFSRELCEQLGEKSNIWFHAVSVGEVLASVPLIKEIKSSHPDYKIICTTVTKTGYQVAQKQLTGGDCVIYAPLDFGWIVRRYIKVIQPKAYISAETEIWPNTYTQLNKANVPILIFNGRISEKSFKGYKRFSFVTRRILNYVQCFCMQSIIDQERIVDLGADAAKTHLVGNIKFDATERKNISSIDRFGLTDKHQILVGGSTHKGEEEILLEVFLKLSKDYPGLRLVIVPRHVERVKEIERYVIDAGLNPLKYSENSDKVENQQDVLIVDQVGHLLEFYKHGTVVFIGKSLVRGGGQNVIEPAIFSKPIVVGPYTSNFKDIIDRFVAGEGIKIVETKEELYEFIKACLDDVNYISNLGAKALEVVQSNRGVAKRTMQYVEQYI